MPGPTISISPPPTYTSLTPDSPSPSPSVAAVDTPNAGPMMLLNGSPTHEKFDHPLTDSPKPATSALPPSQPPALATQSILDDFFRKSTNTPTSAVQNGLYPSGSLDPFGMSVEKAELAIKRLGAVAGVLETAGDLLSCFPMIDPAGAVCSLLAKMLEAAKKVHENKLDALGLVNDSITIVQAVQQQVVAGPAEPSEELKLGIQGLFIKLATNVAFLEDFVNRSKFKMFLYAGKMQKEIESARNETLMYITRFTLESIVSLDQLQQEAKLQREQDRLEFTRRLDEFIKNPGSARNLIENNEVPEVMVTLQREVERQYEVRYRRATPTTRRPDVQFPIPQPYLPSAKPAAQRNTIKQTLGVSLDTDEEFEEQDNEPQATWSDEGPRSHTSRRAWHRTTDDVDIEDSTGEFCKQFLNYLKSESERSSVDLPGWVITEYEVYREQQISTSHFAKVWRGRWHDQVVAIKDLDILTDKQLFLAEAAIWSALDNEFVLPFHGANSAVGPPPWFLVSPWQNNGRITDYITTEAGRDANIIALIHQVSQGMEYLHSRDVVHGDLKGQTILIDDNGHPLLCDFGLSRIKIDITSKSVMPPPEEDGAAGTLRFQSPERLQSGPLTKECDVFSFAMTIFQLYSGEIPFAVLDANSVRCSIIEGVRPPRLPSIPDDLWQLVVRCWDGDPEKRPTFEEISAELSKMYAAPKPAFKSTKSIPGLLNLEPARSDASTDSTESDKGSTDPYVYITDPSDIMPTPEEDEIIQAGILPIDPVLTDGQPDELPLADDPALYVPSQADSTATSQVDLEKYYRRFFNFQDYSHRLNLPQWAPSPVALGDIGYMRDGHFVLLDNALSRNVALGSGNAHPSSNYGAIPITKSAVYPRLISDVARDFGVRIMSSFRTKKTTVTKTVRRQIHVPMIPGRKAVRLIVADGKLQTLRSYTEPKFYLMNNIDWLLKEAQQDGHGELKKTDIVLVVGALMASNYAMAVSDYAPGTTLRFNVVSPTRRHKTEPWGFWTIARDPLSFDIMNRSSPPSLSSLASLARSGSESSRVSGPIPPSPPGLPVLDRGLPGIDDRPLQYSVKTSKPDGPRNAVQLSVLRFPPGGGEPTFYRDLD